MSLIIIYNLGELHWWWWWLKEKCLKNVSFIHCSFVQKPAYYRSHTKPLHECNYWVIWQLRLCLTKNGCVSTFTSWSSSARLTPSSPLPVCTQFSLSTSLTIFIHQYARWNIMVLSYSSIENRTRTFHKMVSPVLNCILHKLVWRARQSSRLTSCFCNLDIEYLYWECLGWHGWNCITYCTAALDFLNIVMSSTTSPLSSTTATVIATIATTTTPTDFFFNVDLQTESSDSHDDSFT